MSKMMAYVIVGIHETSEAVPCQKFNIFSGEWFLISILLHS